MRIEIDKFGNRNEYSDEGKWLYQDRGENDRYFTTIVLLGNAEPAWSECLDIEKVTWNMDFSKDIDLTSWNPTDKGTAFLENFLHHIAERLAVGPTTNRLTLTLSGAVYTACGFGQTTEQGSVQSQIKKAIQDRNWKVTDGTNNFNQ